MKTPDNDDYVNGRALEIGLAPQWIVDNLRTWTEPQMILYGDERARRDCASFRYLEE